MLDPATADVVVVGGGPAGWSTARSCASAGLAVTVVDPRPDAVWPQLYGAWEYELPGDLPAGVVAAGGRPTAIARREHLLDDRYVMLDTAALRAHLRHDAVRVCCGHVVAIEDGPAVVLADGSRVRGRIVLDATGSRQALSRRPRPRRTAAEQTAYGVVVDTGTAHLLTGGRLLFMDWRPRHGHAGWPTFLYAVPLGSGRVLLEETSLARRPALPLGELRARLHDRLRAHGVPASAVPDDRGPDARRDQASRVDRVRFAVDRPRHRPPPGVVPLGAAVPLVHPATGFSLAASLALAPRVAAAATRALDAGADPAAAVSDVVLPPSAAAVHVMRRRGLDVLLRMPPAQVPEFFDGFFTLPARHRRAYLGAGHDLPRALAAMFAVFARLDPALRLHLVAGTVLGPGRGATDQQR